MEKIIEIYGEFKDFIVKEFLAFFLSTLGAGLLTLFSLWLMQEFSFSLVERIEWQGIDDRSLQVFLLIAWLAIIYLVRLVYNAILYITLPKEEEPDEE